MLFPKRDTHYVSPADKYLTEFDRRNQRSASQKAEYEKSLKVAALRDGKVEKAADESDA